jgi:hypothetical protein
MVVDKKEKEKMSKDKRMVNKKTVRQQTCNEQVKKTNEKWQPTIRLFKPYQWVTRQRAAIDKTRGDSHSPSRRMPKDAIGG